jgi:hypothetical protein
MAPTLAQTDLLNTRAQNFVSAHTTVVPTHELSLIEECTICLETYTDEKSVKIIGIEGCTHVIGEGCLHMFLAKEPEKTKKCPVCRAVWIQGNDNKNATVGTSQPQSSQSSWPAAHMEGTPTSALSEQARLRQRQQEQAERREFEAMTQDFESVRLRASRGRHAPSGQRRERPTAASAQASLDPDITTIVPVIMAAQDSYQVLTQDLERIRARAANTRPPGTGYVPWQRLPAASPVSEIPPVTIAVTTGPLSESLESRSEQESYEQYTRAIRDVRARAARTRPSFR